VVAVENSRLSVDRRHRQSVRCHRTEVVLEHAESRRLIALAKGYVRFQGSHRRFVAAQGCSDPNYHGDRQVRPHVPHIFVGGDLS
jgi:hypothetical protein